MTEGREMKYAKVESLAENLEISHEGNKIRSQWKPICYPLVILPSFLVNQTHGASGMPANPRCN
uniref:Uncharacterized protein n=1 Tax=Oryza sativa subsp. japonica TaxID=39947 RepID=Q7EYK3_ORYSJ|nr:hypothetical protein [Oryza sativa Japonica Group]